MAYGARLESALSESSRGFESPILRWLQLERRDYLAVEDLTGFEEAQFLVEA